MERSNFRLIRDDTFPHGFDIITIDVSFISLRTILARAVAYLRSKGSIIALVKPQFEAGRERLGAGGVVRDPTVHRQILEEVCERAATVGLAPIALMASPLLGPAGNREFLLELRRDGTAIDARRIAEVVAEES
jgi:23S rRNA (cytidine1920-2'-O)/16S rRNA (cytidine1409-2'-O)-methyltransferase